MRKIESEELKELQMQILDYIDAFCRKNDIKYTISGGTLLGAVRHGGFIPWDDDVDIQMLRSEYDRFTNLWNEETNHSYYELVNIESGNNMGYPFGKIHDTRTVTYIKDFARTGVFVDVFPVDNVVDLEDFKQRHDMVRKLYGKRNRALFFLLNNNAKSIKIRLLAFLKKPIKSFSDFAVEINRVAKKHENMECPLVFEMISGLICKEPIPKNVFTMYKDIIFENRKYMAVSDYDTYLTKTFGNYMQLPPKEKRVARHSFIAYWK